MSLAKLEEIVKWFESQGKAEAGTYLVKVAETGQMLEVRLIKDAQGEWDVSWKEVDATEGPARGIAGSADPLPTPGQESSSGSAWQKIKSSIKKVLGISN